jgi:hypothetical protein
VLAFFDGLGQLFAKPAFAYSLVALLSIPAIRYFTMTPVPEQTRAARFENEELGGGLRRDFVAGGPVAEAMALLAQYKAAYEARDLDRLKHLWRLSPAQESEIARLFREASGIALLTDVRNVQVRENGTHVTVDFAEVTTRLQGGDFTAVGPVIYTADIRRVPDSGQWVIESLREHGK